MTNSFPLPDGIHDLPNGKLATLVTYLEMHTRPQAREVSLPDGIEFISHTAPTTDWYREIYKTVGEDWLWFSRQELSDSDLSAIITDQQVEIYSLRKQGRDLGLLELDFRDPENTELAFFGLAHELIGTGCGRYLMEQALTLAFAKPINRFFVHTCTLDSPQALEFYIRSGFTPYKRALEIADDPRGPNGLAITAASQIPYLK